MNNTCGKCGGYVGDFIYSGTGAVICNCTPSHKEEKCIAMWKPCSEDHNGNCYYCGRNMLSPTPDSMNKLIAAAKETPYYKEAHPTPTDSWEKLTDGINENNIKEWSVKFVTKNSSRIALEMSIALIDAVMQLDTIGAEPKD